MPKRKRRVAQSQVRLKARPKKQVRRGRSEMPAALAHIEGFDIKAMLRKRGIYLKKRENQRLKAAAIPLAKALVKNKKLKKAGKPEEALPEPQKYTSFNNAEVHAYWEKHIRKVENLEQHFDKAIKSFLINHVLQKAIANLAEVVDMHKSEKIQRRKVEKYLTKQVFSDDDESDLQNQAMIDLEPLLQNMGVIAGQDANKLIGTDDPYIPSDALRKRIQSNVEKFTSSMIDTDQDYLTDLITEGIQAGDSVPQISSKIKNDFTDYSAMQSTRITRTEVLRSANQSALDAFKQSGVVEGKQWVTAGATDECAQYDGDVETLDASFYSADSEFLDGDPPLHPNCRCVLVPVLEENSEAKSVKINREYYRTKILELESLIDKNSKDFKVLNDEHREKRADDAAYIKSLEKYLKLDDGQNSET
jgi:SPP1 gp7 family putative phage head morphogenesis protein